MRNEVNGSLALCYAIFGGKKAIKEERKIITESPIWTARPITTNSEELEEKEDSKTIFNWKNGNAQSAKKIGGASPAKLTNEEVTVQETDGPVVKVEDLDRKKYNTELVSLPLEAMQIVDNPIYGIYESHWSSTLRTFRRLVYDPAFANW